MKKITFLIFVTLFIVTFLIAGCEQQPSTLFPLNKNCRNMELPYEEQEEYLKTEYYTETVPYTDQECETKNLIYSITNQNVNSDCLDWDETCREYTFGFCTEKETYCVKRRVNCNVKLNNLDDEPGRWVIDFTIYGDNELVATQGWVANAYPRSTEDVTGGFMFTGREDSDKTRYSCSYRENTIPTKEVCRDVLKYREVQKSREITAHRPVTKYRTENKCD